MESEVGSRRAGLAVKPALSQGGAGVKVSGSARGRPSRCLEESSAAKGKVNATIWKHLERYSKRRQQTQRRNESS